MTKKLFIFGDSFAAKRNSIDQNLGWPELLTNDYTVTNFAECGVGEYKILKQIESVDLQQADKILISHTSPFRVYVKDHPIHNTSSTHNNCDIIFSDIEQLEDDFSRSCKLYFKYIFDEQYAIDIHNLICEKIHAVTQQLSVLHITHFDYSTLYNFTPMLNFYEHWQKNKGSVNHYSLKGNQYVYDQIKGNL